MAWRGPARRLTPGGVEVPSDCASCVVLGPVRDCHPLGPGLHHLPALLQREKVRPIRHFIDSSTRMPAPGLPCAVLRMCVVSLPIQHPAFSPRGRVQTPPPLFTRSQTLPFLDGGGSGNSSIAAVSLAMVGSKRPCASTGQGS